MRANLLEHGLGRTLLHFWPGRSLKEGEKMLRNGCFAKRTRAAQTFNHGWWLAVGGGWWLVIGGWWRLAVVGGWRLVAVGGWRLAVGGGRWSLGAVLKGGPQQKTKMGFLKGRPDFGTFEAKKAEHSSDEPMEPWSRGCERDSRVVLLHSYTSHWLLRSSPPQGSEIRHGVPNRQMH